MFGLFIQRYYKTVTENKHLLLYKYLNIKHWLVIILYDFRVNIING